MALYTFEAYQNPNGESISGPITGPYEEIPEGYTPSVTTSSNLSGVTLDTSNSGYVRYVYNGSAVTGGAFINITYTPIGAYETLVAARPVVEAAPYPYSVIKMFSQSGYPGTGINNPSATLGYTAWADIDSNGSLDVTIQADVGDRVEYNFSGAFAEGSDYFHLDVQTVSGTARRSWANGISPPPAGGSQGSGAYDSHPTSGSTRANVTFNVSGEVQSSDLNGNYLTLRLCWRNDSSTTATQTLYTDNSNGQCQVRVTNHRNVHRTVLTASQSWEGAGVSEPTVWYDGTQWNMLYTGGITTQYIGYATAPTALGPWTKQPNPVVGNGYGGRTGQAGRSAIYREGNVFYVYYSDLGGNWRCASGTSITALSDAGTMLSSNATETGYENSAVVKAGSTYHAMFESNSAAGYWQIGHATASSPTGPWTVQAFPVTSLQIASGGMYGGPWLYYDGTTFYLWYHASIDPSYNTPTEIFRATSTDCVTWTVTKTPVVQRLLYSEQNQIADPTFDTDGTTRYAFWDAVLAGNAAMQINGSVAALMPITP